MEKQNLQMNDNLGEEIIIRLKELIARLDKIIKDMDEQKFKDPFLDRNRE